MVFVECVVSDNFQQTVLHANFVKKVIVLGMVLQNVQFVQKIIIQIHLVWNVGHVRLDLRVNQEVHIAPPITMFATLVNILIKIKDRAIHVQTDSIVLETQIID